MTTRRAMTFKHPQIFQQFMLCCMQLKRNFMFSYGFFIWVQWKRQIDWNSILISRRAPFRLVLDASMNNCHSSHLRLCSSDFIKPSTSLHWNIFSVERKEIDEIFYMVAINRSRNISFQKVPFCNLEVVTSAFILNKFKSRVRLFNSGCIIKWRHESGGTYSSSLYLFPLFQCITSSNSRFPNSGLLRKHNPSSCSVGLKA